MPFALEKIILAEISGNISEYKNVFHDVNSTLFAVANIHHKARTSLRKISADRSKTKTRPLLSKLEVLTLISSCSFIARTIHTLEQVKCSFFRKIQSNFSNEPTSTKELLLYYILKQ